MLYTKKNVQNRKETKCDWKILTQLTSKERPQTMLSIQKLGIHSHRQEALGQWSSNLWANTGFTTQNSSKISWDVVLWLEVTTVLWRLCIRGPQLWGDMSTIRDSSRWAVSVCTWGVPKIKTVVGHKGDALTVQILPKVRGEGKLQHSSALDQHICLRFNPRLPINKLCSKDVVSIKRRNKYSILICSPPILTTRLLIWTRQGEASQLYMWIWRINRKPWSTLNFLVNIVKYIKC